MKKDTNSKKPGKPGFKEAADLRWKWQLKEQENLAHIAFAFFTDERYPSFYDRHCDAMNGLIGMLHYCMGIAHAFNTAEQLLNREWDENWDDAIAGMINRVYEADSRLNDKELADAANDAIESRSHWWEPGEAHLKQVTTSSGRIIRPRLKMTAKPAQEQADNAETEKADEVMRKLEEVRIKMRDALDSFSREFSDSINKLGQVLHNED